jgi:hypothetical protein
MRTRFSYANIAATLALVAAVAGGTAYAAGKIGGGDIKPDAVRAKHIKDGQVRATETGAGVVDSCGPGSLAAYVEVDASASFPASLTGSGVRGFACEGPALARRSAEGFYIVCFPELEPEALGTVTSGTDHDFGPSLGTDNLVTFTRGVNDPACGDAAQISVRSVDVDGGLEDADFGLIVAAR